MTAFKVGDRVRHYFDGGYIVTTIIRMERFNNSYIYSLELPAIRDDELLLWEDEMVAEA